MKTVSWSDFRLKIGDLVKKFKNKDYDLIIGADDGILYAYEISVHLSIPMVIWKRQSDIDSGFFKNKKVLLIASDEVVDGCDFYRIKKRDYAWALPEEDEKLLRQSGYNILEYTGDNVSVDVKSYAKILLSLLSGYKKANQIEKIFLESLQSKILDEPVILKDMKFWSLCECHLFPFTGTIDIAMTPNVYILKEPEKIIKLISRKIHRPDGLVKMLSDLLKEYVQPKGLAIKLTTHMTCAKLSGKSRKIYTYTEGNIDKQLI